MQKAELGLQGEEVYSGNGYTLKWYLQLALVGLVFFCFLFFCFEAGVLCVALAILEPAL